MTDYTSGGNQITDAHRKLLLDSAITPAVIETSGIVSSPDGTELRFPWTDGVVPTVWQRRPDNPRLNEDGEPVKYEFPKGSKVPFNRLRDGDNFGRLILAEGTRQQYAVLSHAPADFAVYGMSGCYGFTNADLSVVQGRDVFLLLDADLESNANVWTAAEHLTKQAKRHGAKSVAYVFTTGTGKQGVDDVLADMAEEKRAGALRLWLSQASTKLPKRPRAKRADLNETDSAAAQLFRKVDGRMMFQPADAARSIMDAAPAALTLEDDVAMYVDGVYVVSRNTLLSRAVTMLGNFYSPGVFKSLSDTLVGLLFAEGRVLPERMAQPLLNCPNGMVDLRTGALLPHDPAHMSYVQVTTEYRPDMATPEYDTWLRVALRQEGASDADVEALVADLEETAGTMLDPSKTPSKALFLFGPSRSGKSTFLRLLRAVAGAANTSAETLHDLASDTFAKANLYGKMLNVAADLSNAHVADLSNFKMLAGDDVIKANRKYGSQFAFVNQALIAFSANELPTVSEASRAYAERMKPFEFPNSFAGAEDKTLEDRLMAELPGILARWVTAYGRFLARGGYVSTDAAVQAKFEAKSDRVVQFVQDMCTVAPAREGERMGTDVATRRREVAQAFNTWAERNGGSKMGERAFFQRMASIKGVTVVKTGPKQDPSFNLIVAAADEDRYDFGDEPQQPTEAPEVTPAVQPELPQADPHAWAAAKQPDAVPSTVPPMAVNCPLNGEHDGECTYDPFLAGCSGYSQAA